MKCPVCGKEEFIALNMVTVGNYEFSCDTEPCRYLCLNCGHVEHNEMYKAKKFVELKGLLKDQEELIISYTKELMKYSEGKKTYAGFIICGLKVPESFSDTDYNHEIYKKKKYIETLLSNYNDEKAKAKKANIMFQIIKEELGVYYYYFEQSRSISRKDTPIVIVETLFIKLREILNK